MAGLWNTKFDHTNGETRICKECGVSFHTIKPRWRCNACVNIKQKVIEQKKRALYDKKDNYPFSTRTHEAGRRFCSIRTATSNVWKEYKKTGNRDVITAHYDRQLKEIEENGILKWILDRRDKETLEAKQSKSRKTITKDYPNHHDYYEY
jgi:hypothetical protein